MNRAAISLLTLALLTGLSAQDKQTPKKPDATKQDAAKVANPKILMKTSMGDITLELFADECPKTVANFVGLAEGDKEFKDARSGEMVKRPFYDGLIFHRVIKNFMAQGGCPLGAGHGSPGFKFEDEINAKALGLDKKKAFVSGPQGFRPAVPINRQLMTTKIVRPIADGLGIKNENEFKQRFAEVQKELQKLSLMEALVRVGYKYNDKRGSHRMLRGTIAMANSGPNTNGSQFFINMVDNEYLNGMHTVFGRVLSGMDVIDKMQTVEAEGSKPKTDIKIVSIRRMDAKPDNEDKPKKSGDK